VLWPLGITLGAGASFLVGNALYTKSAREEVAAFALTPYVVLAPQFWTGDAHARSCAAQGTRGDRGGSFASCLPYKFGLLLGRPFNYDATITIPRDVVQEHSRSVRPAALLAVAFLPNAYLTTAVGWTFATVTRDDGTDARMGAITLLAGVNLDLLGGI
jgi:hypothetical protein